MVKHIQNILEPTQNSNQKLDDWWTDCLFPTNFGPPRTGTHHLLHYQQWIFHECCSHFSLLLLAVKCISCSKRGFYSKPPNHFKFTLLKVPVVFAYSMNLVCSYTQFKERKLICNNNEELRNGFYKLMLPNCSLHSKPNVVINLKMPLIASKPWLPSWSNNNISSPPFKRKAPVLSITKTFIQTTSFNLVIFHCFCCTQHLIKCSPISIHKWTTIPIFVFHKLLICLLIPVYN